MTDYFWPLPVGRTQHDEPVHRFEGPTALDEARREMIEQFRMRGWLAAHAEIVGRGDETATEMILPEAVGHHAGGERVIGPGQPLREFEPATALGAGGQ